LAPGARAQLIDLTQAPNTAKAGINKSLADEIGPGRGDLNTVGSSIYIINRDPFRSVRRGRQIFQRKFTHAQGQGPGINDGLGPNNEIETNVGIGAGLADSCAACHGRPRGSAGSGGDVVTRPDSRDSPHLFGLGLKEMLADEITGDLRTIQAQAVAAAVLNGTGVTLPLVSKGIYYGLITAHPDRSVDTSQVQGVNPDLRVRPFFAQGKTISIREFTVGALNAEMGLQDSTDPDLDMAANHHQVVTTPSGMILDGAHDAIEAPPPPDALTGAQNEIDPAVVDHLEFYLLNYFRPGLYQQTGATSAGLKSFNKIGCASCHIQNLQINHDRRVADIDTSYDPTRGIFNNLFATATALFSTVPDGSGGTFNRPSLQPFLVTNIFTDFKRHDLGANFYERNYDGTLQTQFLTRALWGVGSTGPYGHDGRSINLTEVILRHGGEALASRNAFAGLDSDTQQSLVGFLNSLVLFPPDDTASTLDPGNPSAASFPQFGHGSIKLTVLFNNPSDPE
jgi:mono/diheme cytochrome c family protein